MAQTKKVSGTPTRTAAEIKEWYEQNYSKIQKFEKIQEALRLLDPTKNVSRSYSTFDKTKLRTYMKNPISQYKNLRNLSRYLYYRSSVYRRLIWFLSLRNIFSSFTHKTERSHTRRIRTGIVKLISFLRSKFK